MIYFLHDKLKKHKRVIICYQFLIIQIVASSFVLIAKCFQVHVRIDLVFFNLVL